MKGYHDIVGEGGSRVLDQVAEQRNRLADSLAEVRHVVAVGSGKGGVGKSTLTFQIASILRSRGREVAILDADFNGPTQARLAGLPEAPPLPGTTRARLPRTPSGIGVFSMGSLVPEAAAVDFESVAPGESHTWRATREFAVLGEVLRGYEWGRLDLLLLDLPPGAERTFQYAEYLGERAAFVVVTVPSDLACGVVTRSVAALAKTPNRVLGYVLNMNGYWCDECGKVKPLFPRTGGADLGVPCLGSVPFDPELARRCDAGIAIGEADGSPAGREIAAAAGRILDRLEERP